ncbi:MAG: hypothetical protein WD711_09470 [Dongiaceae bacterium]
MAKVGKKTVKTERTNTEIRTLLLQYFYDRNRNATSARGKKGAAVKISDIKRDLKEQHGLSQQDVVSNLTYLTSQQWVEIETIKKDVPVRSGVVIPQVTEFYRITAMGIDKIEGPGEFTVDRFKGIKIEATGQNIITVGDGNQVNALFRDAAVELVKFKDEIRSSDRLTEGQKLDLIADVDTIQSQLAKEEPDRSVIKKVWAGIREVAIGVGLTANTERIVTALGPLLGS